MKKTTWMAYTTLTAALFTSSVMSAPAPSDPKKHTPQGLYIDAKETAAMMKKDPKVILVDVRTPEEWQFVGHTRMAQIMVPSVQFDYSKMDEKKPRYKSIINDHFISELEEKAADLGADEESTYILMCRSGATRAQPAAKMMHQYGYKNVYIMTDGFEGSKTKEGEKKGFRLEDGWKNSGQPWTYNLDEKQAYFVK